LIWTFITTLTETDLKKLNCDTTLEKFNNIEKLLLPDSPNIPKDLSKLTTLQVLHVDVMKCNLTSLEKMTNLRELKATQKNYSFLQATTLDGVLKDHLKLTHLYLLTENIGALSEYLFVYSFSY